jgi:hypothetical protein
LYDGGRTSAGRYRQSFVTEMDPLDLLLPLLRHGMIRRWLRLGLGRASNDISGGRPLWSGNGGRRRRLSGSSHVVGRFHTPKKPGRGRDSLGK